MNKRLLSISAGLLVATALSATVTPKPIKPIQPPPTIQQNECCGGEPPYCPPNDPNCKL